MTTSDQLLKTGTKRIKRKFSLEDKRRYYDLWKTSGLTRVQFCKEQHLVSSAFGNWCRSFSTSDKVSLATKNNWIPIVPKEKSSNKEKEPMVFEVKIHKSVKICLAVLFIILFAREFVHAINTVW